MKWKNLLTIIVLNIFLLCLVSLFNEYDSMRHKLQRLDSTFDLAVDTAISSCMASEELFSSEYMDKVSSRGFDHNNKHKYSESKVKIFRGGKWITGNTYIMAMYYEDNGGFPLSQGAYYTYESTKNVNSIYKWLFGDVGSQYNDSNLNWANKYQSVLIKSTNRTPRYKFKQFYNNVGRQMTTNIMVKEKIPDTESFSIKTDYEVPTLAMMGLNLEDGYSGRSNLNTVNSTVTADSFTSSANTGKNNTVFFNTPYSLGVTYVPVEVLKPTVLSHLEQMIRFSKCKQSPNDDIDMTDIKNIYKSADGCIPNSLERATGEEQTNGFGWYENADGTLSSDELEHKYPSNTKSYIGGVTDILNDGNIEYDMNSLRVKVDYFVVDFYNNNNYKIVNYIEGATPNKNVMTLPSRLKETDTSDDSNKTGKRIVAKVTVKMKIHIPYESPILTWLASKTSTSSNNHYGVKLWNPATGDIESNYDGLWYQYSTYTAITR